METPILLPTKSYSLFGWNAGALSSQPICVEQKSSTHEPKQGMRVTQIVSAEYLFFSSEKFEKKKTN
ncbi:hypothetical protein OUZ56_001926 [Daphnia magna]|uniref:Uncharacterized protein n=1 Tax=Daphnia magna TaxID=35525 RepID=A0ABR0A458_9CRUS|nr:hypothetical protein OUZ56_001926 [Daphnia magna]